MTFKMKSSKILVLFTKLNFFTSDESNIRRVNNLKMTVNEIQNSKANK